MAVGAKDVAQLRSMTGAGLMDCKKALVEAEGDMKAAEDILRKKDLAKADKKGGREAVEGVIAMASDDAGVAMVEINSETDFVARDESFSGFASAVANVALAGDANDSAALSAAQFDGDETVEEARIRMVAKIGENLRVRRCYTCKGPAVYHYSHQGRIGVVVQLSADNAELGRNLAMHIAASSPVAIDVDSIPADVVEDQKRIFVAQAEESGKPPEIIEKMIAGKLGKFLAAQTLVGQPYVRDPSMTVGDLLKSAGLNVLKLERFEVGEGLEKTETDFAEEVMATVKGS